MASTATEPLYMFDTEQIVPLVPLRDDVATVINVSATESDAHCLLDTNGQEAGAAWKYLDAYSNSILKVELALSCDTLTEPTLQLVARTMRDPDDKTTGGTFNNTSSSTWYSAAASAGDLVYWDITSFMPSGATALDTIIALVIQHLSGTGSVYLHGIKVTYSSAV